MHKIAHRFIPLIVFILFFTQQAQGLGRIGHRVTGLVAEKHLSAKAKQQVKMILGDDSLAEVATWADHMRSNPHHFWKKISASWHYLTIPDNSSFQSAKKNPKGDIYLAITAMELILSDKKVPSGPIREGLKDYFGDLNAPANQQRIKQFAMKFLVHLVGDLHQPLHVGNGNDWGGNKVKVLWFGQKTNLHTVWDSKLIDYQKLSFTEYADFIDIQDTKKISIIQKAPLEQWIEESIALRKNVYAIGDGKLGYHYIYKNGPLLDKQLLKAGLRLAKILNDIYQ